MFLVDTMMEELKQVITRNLTLKNDRIKHKSAIETSNYQDSHALKKLARFVKESLSTSLQFAI